MKTRLALIGLLGFSLLAVAEPRTCVFKKGGKFEGDYVSSGTTTVVVSKAGTNFFLSIADLSTNDQVYVINRQLAQRQAELEAETNKMTSAGMIELTANVIENFPEKVDNRSGWMDAKFVELYDGHVYARLELGFWVRDKNDDGYFNFFVQKQFRGPNFPLDLSNVKPNPLVPVISNLKAGDKIRLIGKVIPFSFYSDHRLFEVQKVEMIESAAEEKLIADADTNLLDITP